MHGSFIHQLRADGHFRAGTPALDRFLAKCRFDPGTGCVVWVGGKTKGRGKNVDYGSFKDKGRRWFAHRWAAKYIHGFEIDGLQVDHCCPNIPIPNTLCVAHLQAKTLIENVLLQHERRKRFIHLEVGLLPYEDLYGRQDAAAEETIPFYEPPAWLGIQEPSRELCPF